MSFRLKMILSIAAIEAVLLFILIANSLSFLRTSNEDELRKRAETAATLFATTTKDAVLANDLASLQSFVKAVLRNPGLVYARVRNRDGLVLAESGDPATLARPFHASPTVGGATDGVFDASADIAVAGVTYGHVEIGLSVNAIGQVLAVARTRTIIIALIEMTLVALVSFILGLYLTRGVAALKGAYARLARGELGATVPVYGHDELAEMAQGFNQMSHQLAASDEKRRRAEDALTQLNQELEHRVHARTQELAAAYDKIEHQALHDPLTGLPNRELFYDRLQQAIRVAEREKKMFAVMILDLNLFKEVNDTYGHEAGDLVLREVACRLKELLRASDVVARMGGDEFAILLSSLSSRVDAGIVADKIREKMQTPIMISMNAVDIGASLGIALFPNDGSDHEALLRCADIAMYIAKRNKGGVAYYNPEYDQERKERHALLHDLQRALTGVDQLLLHYQPIIDVTSGHCCGVEALVRWQHPQRGMLFPDAFIPLTEEAGITSSLGLYVLREALRQHRAWQNLGLGPNFKIAINISAADLQGTAFSDGVAAALANSGKCAASLEFEITETALMEDPLRAAETLSRLRNLGIAVSIDDFGTGYSSMAYLKYLPVSAIKIDKSFVINMRHDSNDATIVSSIVALGHNLGLWVVAEGVEDLPTLNELKSLGCDFAQGHYFRHPVPADELVTWLEKLHGACRAVPRRAKSAVKTREPDIAT